MTLVCTLQPYASHVPRIYWGPNIYINGGRPWQKRRDGQGLPQQWSHPVSRRCWPWCALSTNNKKKQYLLSNNLLLTAFSKSFLIWQMGITEERCVLTLLPHKPRPYGTAVRSFCYATLPTSPHFCSLLIYSTCQLRTKRVKFPAILLPFSLQQNHTLFSRWPYRAASRTFQGPWCQENRPGLTACCGLVITAYGYAAKFWPAFDSQDRPEIIRIP